MIGFSGIVDIDQADIDLQYLKSLEDESLINRWKGIVSRFKVKLIKMIKDVNGRFYDHSVSPKIRQILLHWSYELVESDLL